MDQRISFITLGVRDLDASRAFYEGLGFEVTGGDPAHDYLILKNGETTIGLFQGMFQKKIRTFNPGWSPTAEPLAEFQDVRDIQTSLKGQGVEFIQEADPESTSVASFVITDPDGNSILVDQHVPRPGN